MQLLLKKRSFAVLAAIILAAPQSFAVGSLGIGDVTVEDSLLIIPIVLGGDVSQGVSGLNFSLSYDPKVLEPVSAAPGAVALQANKDVQMNVPTPGELTIVVIGLNQTVFQLGEVARLTMRRVGSPEGGIIGLGLANPSLATRDGTEFEARAVPFSGYRLGASGSSSDDSSRDRSDRPERRNRPTSGAPNGSDAQDEAEDDIPARTAVVAAPDGMPDDVAAQPLNAAARVADALGRLADARSQIGRPAVDDTAENAEPSVDEESEDTQRESSVPGSESSTPSEGLARRDDAMMLARTIPNAGPGNAIERAAIVPGGGGEEPRRFGGLVPIVLCVCVLLGGSMVALVVKRLR